MPTDFKYWTRLIKETIEPIADEKYQRYEWFDNKAKTWFFPTEMFCSFFDDANAEDFFNNKEAGLNESQRSAGKNLVEAMRVLLSKYPKPDEHAEQLADDPLMANCRQAASRVLSLLE